MAAKLSWPPVVLALVLLLVVAGMARSGNIAVYWGQDGGVEGTLGAACLSGNYAYVILAFLTNFGNGREPVLDLSGRCHPTFGCTEIGAEIRACKAQGIKVLLSLGGYSGSYGLSSKDDANSVAKYLWENFLGGGIGPVGPFELDGIDFHINTGGDPSYYDDLAKALRARRKDVLLTAAPQCPFPDALIGPALEAVQFDAVWVRFYNNEQCQYKNADPSNLLDAWNKWNSSSVDAGRFYLGLPAAANAAPSGGHIPADQLGASVLPHIKGGGQIRGDHAVEPLLRRAEQMLQFGTLNTDDDDKRLEPEQIDTDGDVGAGRVDVVNRSHL
ncbi:hypothetical protein EJB05_36959, partial [Eragrostis curvula]